MGAISGFLSVIPVLLGLSVLSPAAAGTSTLTADLDGDGALERLVLDAQRDPALSVWRGGKCLWRGVPRRWHPWKLVAADVDGAGCREIILGVDKATRFWPRPHHCLFVFGWDGKCVYPRWLGSRLSKPFSDFAFADLDGDGGEELVSLETTREGRQCAVVYRWCGFGFEGVSQSGDWRRARFLPAGPGRVLIEADGRRYRVTRQGAEPDR